MVEEIVYQDIRDLFEDKGFPVAETTLYLEDEINRDSIFGEVEGVYIPRNFTGVVRNDNDEQEVKRRYTHELGHGAFCENLPLGQSLVALDRKVSRLEESLYGKYPSGKFVSLPADVETAIKIDKSQAEQIAQQPLEDAERYYLVDSEKFEEYLSTRSELESFYRDNVLVFEGFSLVAEREVFGEVPGLEERPELQQKGYEEVCDMDIEELGRVLRPSSE